MKIVSAVVLVLLSTGLGQAAERFRLREDTAFAQFQATDASGCITTTAIVLVVADTLGPTSHPSGGFLIVSVATVNFCANDEVLFDVISSVPIDPAQFQMRGSLAAAALHASIPVLDRLGGRTSVWAVDVVWSPVGPARPEIRRLHEHLDDRAVLNSTAVAVVRDAAAQASVSDGVTQFLHGLSLTDAYMATEIFRSVNTVK